MSRRQQYILSEAYRILENATPLVSDCGALCSAACCRGDAGMWLFPGEAELLQNISDFEIKNGDGNEGYPFLLCHCMPKDCPRAFRPLSCRIFPLFPYVILDERHPERIRVRAAMDPRAMRVCPLLKDENAPVIDKAFRLRVERVGRMLMQDRELAAYLRKTSGYLGELAALL